MPKVDETPEIMATPNAGLPSSSRASTNVALKLPTFWPENAEVWFAQAEAQFAIKSISISRTKFYYAVASLPQEVATQILDLIRAPPAGDPYEVLRERLVTLYSLNDYQRFEALVSLTLFGDQKPPHLMNRMLALLPDDHKPDFILRGLFLRRLPIEVRSHLLQEKISDPRALALKADELFQSRVSSPVNLLSEQLEDASVHAVAVKNRTSPVARRSATPAPSSRSPVSPGPCWYHKKHGSKAQQCRKPCSESEN